MNMSIEEDTALVKKYLSNDDGWQDAEDALDRLAAAARGKEWQRIEDAPKDGTWFLASDSFDSDVAEARWFNGHWYGRSGGIWFGVTHFQPLPAPPAKEGK